ncbi:MAG: DsrE family protein [Pseudomonadota bacterium]|nr:DsrE family protein [Pseudomonadota bacterium]
MSPPDKLSLIIQSGEFNRVHYGLVMASAALATGKDVTLFFTMDGTRAITLGFADGPQEKMLAQKGLATFEELLIACAEMDATFMVCEMGMRATAVSRGQLRTDIKITEGSAVSFLADASANGAILYI